MVWILLLQEVHYASVHPHQSEKGEGQTILISVMRNPKSNNEVNHACSEPVNA
jgi:predicted lactoylglutathione lyase